MKVFSAKNLAQCPNCGEMKPTNATPQQIEDGDWECTECYNRSGRDRAEDKSIERGQKEISKYDPEYEFLVKLIQLVIKEGVPSQEVKDLSNAYPFVTVDDVGDLTAKVWSLATQKYQIPSEWLTNHLPKTGSLKTAGQITQLFNTKVYTNPNRAQILNALKTSELNGLRYIIDNQANTYVWDAAAAVHQDMGEALGLSDETVQDAGYVENPADADFVANSRNKVTADLWPAQEQAGDMLSHDHNSLSYNPLQEADTSVSGPRPEDVDKTSKSKKLNIDMVVQILNAKDPKVVKIDMTGHTLELADGSVLSFDDAAKRAMDIDKTSEFSGAEFSNTEFNDTPTLDNGPFSSPEDQGAKPQKQPFPNTNWVPADDENQDEQPWSNVASILKHPFSKKARMDAPAWIDPNGQIFTFTDNTHDTWAEANADMLKTQYNLDLSQMDPNTDSSVSYLIDNGWTRAAVADTAIVLNTKDVGHIDQLDGYIAQNWQPNFQYVLLETFNGNWQVFDPFPTLSKGVQKSKKMGAKAALTPQAYWIDAKGTWYTVRAEGLPEITHSGWARDNIEMLQEKYPELNIPKDPRDIVRFDFYRALLQNGWVRIGDSRGASYQIQTADPLHLHPSIIDWVYQNVPDGSSIEIDDANGGIDSYVSLEMPVENIEKEVARELQRKRMGKHAALSGQVVNEVLQSIHSNGGTTYNLSQGNLAGTPNFAVSIYPDRERIVDGVDFEVLEGYMDENEDLLNDANNSFGAWSNGGKVYLDVVATVPDRDQAIDLATQHNQIAIWDLQNNQEISTGGTGGGNVHAFSKSVMSKTAEDNVLYDADQDAIAAASSPVYVMAVNNYAEALKRGHDKDRSLDYAIESVQNLDKIDPKKLVEFINTYL